MFCVDKIRCDRRFLILCPLFVILQIAKYANVDSLGTVPSESSLIPSRLS